MYILITYISQIFYKFSKKVASEKIYFREFINYPQVSRNNTGLEKRDVCGKFWFKSIFKCVLCANVNKTCFSQGKTSNSVTRFRVKIRN